MNINGYSMKAVKEFDTPDGGGYNAKIYFENKRICDVHDAGMGAPPYVNWFIAKNDDQCCKTQDEHEPILDEWFISELFSLYTKEKDFKKAEKKYPNCCMAYVELNTMARQFYIFPTGRRLPAERIKESLYENIPKEEIKKVTIYRFLDDFVVTYPAFDKMKSAIENLYKKCSDDPGIKKYSDELKRKDFIQSLQVHSGRMDTLENVRKIIKAAREKEKFRIVYAGWEAEHLLVIYDRKEEYILLKQKTAKNDINKDNIEQEFETDSRDIEL